MEVKNLTYYDTEGIEHLVQRVIHAIEGLPEPPNGNVGTNVKAKSVEQVVVDYYGGSGFCSVAIKRGTRKYGSGEERLRIGIGRRTKVFGSELETVAALAGEEPKLPDEVMEQIAHDIARALAPYTFQNAVKQAYPDSEKGWGWPERGVRRLMQEEVLPCCEVAIHTKSEKGSSFRKQLLLAKDAFDRKKFDLGYRRQERQSAQDALEKAIEAEARAEVDFVKARNKLEQLKQKEQ